MLPQVKSLLGSEHTVCLVEALRTKHKRANSTSTCQPTHYIKHRLQKTPQPLPEQQEEYVFMQPVHKAPEPVKSVPPSCRQNYDQLTTIEERSLREEGPVSDYENYPLPADVAKATPIVFQPTYENFASTMTPDTTPSVTKHDDPLPDTLQTDPAPPVSSKSCDMTILGRNSKLGECSGGTDNTRLMESKHLNILIPNCKYLLTNNRDCLKLRKAIQTFQFVYRCYMFNVMSTFWSIHAFNHSFTWSI